MSYENLSPKNDALLAALAGTTNWRALVEAPHRGTLDDYDRDVTHLLDETRSVGVETREVKRVLALHWLRRDRPVSFLARVRWVWAIVREAWER